MEATEMNKKKKKKDDSTVRKGTWKAEEDQVLIKHVEKYGPREWSSIRSKGLLQRTGKSCRLRWVNKLQPNLKTGCKFTEEEERVVIELQSRYGNKWAKIATHLTGRTDNDVKNFWSSRQKRLARILRTTSAAAAGSCCSSSSININSKPSRNKTTSSTKRDSSSPASAYGNLIYLPEEETGYYCSSETIKTVTFLEPAAKPAESNSLPAKSEAEVVPSVELEPIVMSSEMNVSFPEMKTEPPEPEDFIAFSPESQQILAGLGENPFLFFDVFGSAGGAADDIIPHHQLGDALPQELLDPCTKLPATGGCVNDTTNTTGGGGFGDVDGKDEDFPANYVFDQIDDLPSPSKW